MVGAAVTVERWMGVANPISSQHFELCYVSYLNERFRGSLKFPMAIIKRVESLDLHDTRIVDNFEIEKPGQIEVSMIVRALEGR